MTSGDIQKQLITVLGKAAQRLREADLPAELAAQMERLAEQVDQPCMVAVVGQVKAGKSTFINALLGQDLAKVGTTETTATINYFRYGQPNPDHPVRCYWRNGSYTDVDRTFLDSLQGNDIETLHRAEGIDHLEYYLDNPYLQQVTLVDTPGTGAVVDEHQNRTAEFMQLQGQLRERHDQETQQLGSRADAVIYVIGATARTTDRDFLEEFRQATTRGGARALNAIGVMAKIELHPEIMRRREELAATITSQLHDSLNTVIPVASGVRCALDRLLEHDQAGLQRLMSSLRSLPPATLEMMLKDSRLFLQWERPDCPVSTAERKELLADTPWMVFKIIAQVAADPSLGSMAVVERLETLADFRPLRDVLERHFFKRRHFLRGHRILQDAYKVLKTVKFTCLPEFRKREREDKLRQERFLTFIRQSNGDPVVGRELEVFVRERFVQRARLEPLIDELDRDLGHIFHELKQYNADFETLQQVEDHVDLFSEAELDELRALLGLYGMETEKRLPPGQHTSEYVENRQQYWMEVSMLGRNPIRRDVAERAVLRYGFILEEIPVD